MMSFVCTFTLESGLFIISFCYMCKLGFEKKVLVMSHASLSKPAASVRSLVYVPRTQVEDLFTIKMDLKSCHTGLNECGALTESSFAWLVFLSRCFYLAQPIGTDNSNNPYRTLSPF